MLTLLILWPFLMAVCATTGLAVLRLTGSARFDRAGDRLILAVWLGLGVLSVLLQAISLALPLSPLVGIVLAGLLVFFSLLRPDVRADIAALRTGLSLPMLLAALLLLAGVAAYAAQPVLLYDTGLYHFGAISWLSRFGAVPGLALIHIRFSFISSWFALAAPFNAPGFQTHMAALTGGVVLLLASVHLLLCATRCLMNRARPADWLAFSALTLVILIGLHLSSFVSASPDVPIVVLTIVIAWTMMLILDSRKANKSNEVNLGTALVPFILSMSAATMKLSAVPLVIVSALFYLRYFFSGRSLLVLTVVGLVMIAPTIAMQIVFSGCPFFPTGAPCLGVPWRLDPGEGPRIAGAITEWARWNGPAPPHANTFNWLGRWVLMGTSLKSKLLILSIFMIVLGWAMLVVKRQSRIGRTILILGSAGLISVGMFRAHHLLIVLALLLPLVTYKTRFMGKAWLTALSISGVVLMISGAPDLRFGLGYVAILCSCIAVAYCHSLERLLEPVTLRLQSPRLARHLLPLLLAGAGLTLSAYSLRQRVSRAGLAVDAGPRGFLVLPPRLPVVEVMRVRMNGVEFYQPVRGDQCWGAPLPCVPSTDTLADVTLRDPVRGIAAGFKHGPEPVPNAPPSTSR
jgi:hypothetical protein